MQIKYVYSNGTSKIHSTFVKPKTVIKECGNAKQVKLYKYKKVYNAEEDKWEEITEYITTNLIQ